MRLLLLIDWQMRRLFEPEGNRFRFFPAGRMLPGMVVDRVQRRRLERSLPETYARLLGIVVAANLLAVGGIVLWDRFVGYVDPGLALLVFLAVLGMLAVATHGWLYWALRRIMRGG
ncbi:MAG: hypothetical protein HKM95_06750 [Inquilinus sp.]|nr:hypothetical protein [Inquilinus sp.]